MLKRYDISLFTILMLLLAASLVSCEKEINDPASNQSPIVFGDVATRAVVESVESMETVGFGVFASMNGAAGTSAAAEYSLFMENENVYWDDTYDTYGAWTYDNTQYWTKGRNYHFFAYYPYEAEMNDAKPISAVEMNADFGYDLTFTTPQKADIDLLTAYTTEDTSADNFNASKSVTLAFTHALVNVNLNIWRDGVKHQNDQMRIIHVTLGNIRKSGTYSSNEDKWSPTNEKITLENSSVFDKIEAAVVNSDGTLTPGVDDPAKPFTDQLLIPQTIDASNKVSLKIYYQLWRDTGDGTDPNGTKNWEDVELETELPYGTWEPNRRYTYNVVLSSVKDIAFYYIQTKITPWGAPQVGGTIIIK